jgi:hypothetical protein
MLHIFVGVLIILAAIYCAPYIWAWSRGMVDFVFLAICTALAMWVGWLVVP